MSTTQTLMPRVSSPRLLIIDDENIVLKSCRKILGRTDYQIDTVGCGEDAFALLDTQYYDIIITDLKMPGMGGIEVLKRLKKRDPQQVVIVFTGYANVDTARESLKLGAFDYIPKPFTPSELLDVINNALIQVASQGKTKGLDLMAIVAHEFKSPVATLHTTIDTLYEGYFGNLSGEQRKVLESIMRNCQYLEDIIRCFIDLSQVEMNELGSVKKNINLKSLVIDPVLETPDYLNNLKKMNLQFASQETPEIYGDPDLLKIVFNNLINNAIKYGYANTDININLGIENKNIVLSVHNQGYGISADDITNKLFSKFGRLKQKGTEGIKGSGLGLYICKLIIEKHLGQIEVHSEVNKFVEFRVVLPCKS